MDIQTNKSEPYHIIFTKPHNTRNFDSKWFDRVYLCYEDQPCDNTLAIKGFKCYKFNSFEDVLYTKMMSQKNVRKLVVPICRWIPNYFDKYILDSKLKKVFWLGEHRIFHSKEVKK